MNLLNPTRIRCAAVVAIITVATPFTARAQDMGPFTPWTGEPGITETVAEIMAREALVKAWQPEDGLRMVHEFFMERSGLPQDPDSPAVAFWPPMPGVTPVAQPEQRPGGGLPFLPQVVSTSFLGASSSDSGYIPPDTCGAVGTTQVMIHVNGRVKVFSKTGVLGALNATADTFFNSVRGGSAVVDPQCMFDRLTGRWFMVGITTSTPNRIVMAVSGTGTVTGTSSFTFFQFHQDLAAPAGNTGQFADHPKCGVDASALYIGCNMFGGSYTGATGWVVRKSDMIAGTLTVTALRNIGTTSGGIFTPTGVTNDDPGATEGYFVGPHISTFGQVVIRRVNNPGGSPSVTNLTVTVPTTNNPQSVPCLGTTGSLDALDDRMACAQIHLNQVTGVRTLWTAHQIEVNASGVANTSGNRDGMRWYEIQNMTGTPSLRQSGTLFDSSASLLNYWMGSVAMSGQGHMALACTTANASERAQIAAAGRFRTDTLGTIQAPTLAQTSTTAYNAQGSGTQRWGDYSTAYVDPSDDQSIWQFQQYCNANNSWAVRAIKLLAPPPPAPSSCSPPSVGQGSSNVNVVVTGTGAAGSEYFDPDVSFPNHIAASVGGSGVTVNSVSWNPATPTQVTMNISVTGGAATGARNVTVTNPDGQLATGTGVLTITSASVCPTFSQHPTGGLYCQGNNVVLTVAASGTPAPTLQWRKNTADLGGETGTTLTLNNIQPGDAGSYDCVATNACGSTPSNAAGITVSVAPTITSDPSDQGVKAVYNSATFMVGASGSPTLTYQWRKNTVNLVNGGSVSGATSPTLVFNPADLSDNGSSIDCVVSNGCGSDTSAAATYTVFCPADFNMDGFVTGEDFDEFVIEFEAGNASADFNNDTFVTGEDFDGFVDAFVAGC